MCLMRKNQVATSKKPMRMLTSGIQSFLPSLPTLSPTTSPHISFKNSDLLLLPDNKRPGGLKPPIEARYWSKEIPIFTHQGYFKVVGGKSSKFQS